LASRAYEDTALPIGHGQTLSQPHVVALMTTALLEGSRRARVLEVGTGSGYQAAILAQLLRQVYTVERIQALIDRAQTLIRRLELYNVYFRHSNGRIGWPEKAPFDGILLTAAPRQVPGRLLDQLAVGGRLIAPVGDAGQQELVLVERGPVTFSERRLGRVSFVPLIAGIE
jgi:protein-L-isoaspartate(D-aspartate) O-methyltransferase